MSTGTICLSCRAWLGDCQCGNTVASDDGRTPNEFRDRVEIARAMRPQPINGAVAMAVSFAIATGEFHRTLAAQGEAA